MARVRNLKEILVRLKGLSQLMVDLGYAALIEDDFELAQEAIRVKAEIRELSYELRKEALLVARYTKDSRHDIPQIASLLQIGVAIKEMSDGVDDLLEVVIRNVGVHPIIRMAYTRKELRTMRFVVEEGSLLDGKKLEEVEIDLKTGFRVVAIRRKEEWILDPHGKTRIKGGDVLIVEGRDISIRKMQEHVKGPKEKAQEKNSK
ncbi:hypothetical protein DRP53_05585 [candidate division WOR-3 bacterium]|uniref:RCK C-terminal domain-containing protein n=1 Tax=candidate division WOR-3 bacterium TaxID=2052148 RepID=A0A660SHF8_UNCW3|nr:MAG: hypothetical protein DRP53_05585 [candidate division WOR-3 bacterium]